MLKVYAWNICPHCHKAVAWLREKEIPFEYLEIEDQPQEVIQKVIEVNGGVDWVVPTLEFNGQWRPGQVFNATKLEADLKKMGINLTIFNKFSKNYFGIQNISEFLNVNLMKMFKWTISNLISIKIKYGGNKMIIMNKKLIMVSALVGIACVWGITASAHGPNDFDRTMYAIGTISRILISPAPIIVAPQPAPVVVQTVTPAPVVVAPPAPVVVAPAPVYYTAPPPYYYWGPRAHGYWEHRPAPVCRPAPVPHR